MYINLFTDESAKDRKKESLLAKTRKITYESERNFTMEQKNHRLLQCALEIMKYISEQPKGVSFKEICTVIDLPKSSTHNLVQTMCNMGFLQKKENYNEYRIGLK